MEIRQSRHSNRIRYVFGEDEVQYSLQDGSGSRSFSVQYTGISRDRQVLEERNQWLRNVGLLWLLLGAGVTVASFFGEGPAKLSFWVCLGAFCYAVYRLRWTKFTLLPTDKGNLLVIDDAEGPRVIQELESRRAAQFLREHDFIDESETPEQQRKRFKWLRSEGALSEEEFEKRMGMSEAAAETRESSRLLN